MDKIKKAFEVDGLIDDKKRLLINEPLPIKGPKKVKVLILIEEDDLDEENFYKSLSENPSFNFLKEPEEDIYSIEDGKDFKD